MTSSSEKEAQFVPCHGTFENKVRSELMQEIEVGVEEVMGTSVT